MANPQGKVTLKKGFDPVGANTQRFGVGDDSDLGQVEGQFDPMTALANQNAGQQPIASSQGTVTGNGPLDFVAQHNPINWANQNVIQPFQQMASQSQHLTKAGGQQGQAGNYLLNEPAPTMAQMPGRIGSDLLNISDYGANVGTGALDIISQAITGQQYEETGLSKVPVIGGSIEEIANPTTLAFGAAGLAKAGLKGGIGAALKGGGRGLAQGTSAGLAADIGIGAGKKIASKFSRAAAPEVAQGLQMAGGPVKGAAEMVAKAGPLGVKRTAEQIAASKQAAIDALAKNKGGIEKAFGAFGEEATQKAQQQRQAAEQAVREGFRNRAVGKRSEAAVSELEKALNYGQVMAQGGEAQLRAASRAITAGDKVAAQQAIDAANAAAAAEREAAGRVAAAGEGIQTPPPPPPTNPSVATGNMDEGAQKLVQHIPQLAGDMQQSATSYIAKGARLAGKAAPGAAGFAYGYNSDTHDDFRGRMLQGLVMGYEAERLRYTVGRGPKEMIPTRLVDEYRRQLLGPTTVLKKLNTDVITGLEQVPIRFLDAVFSGRPSSAGTEAFGFVKGAGKYLAPVKNVPKPGTEEWGKALAVPDALKVMAHSMDPRYISEHDFAERTNLAEMVTPGWDKMTDAERAERTAALKENPGWQQWTSSFWGRAIDGITEAARKINYGGHQEANAAAMAKKTKELEKSLKPADTANWLEEQFKLLNSEAPEKSYLYGLDETDPEKWDKYVQHWDEYQKMFSEGKTPEQLWESVGKPNTAVLPEPLASFAREDHLHASTLDWASKNLRAADELTNSALYLKPQSTLWSKKGAETEGGWAGRSMYSLSALSPWAPQIPGTKVKVPIGKTLFPFRLVPSNVFDDVVNHIPGVGLLNNLGVGNVDKSMLAAKQVMGSLAIAGVYAIAGNRVQGGGPADKNARGEWFGQGNLPWQWQGPDGKWRPIEGTAPGVDAALRFVGALNDYHTFKQPIPDTVLKEFGYALADQGFFPSILQLAQNVLNGGQDPAHQIAFQVGGLAGQNVSLIGSMTDPYKRDITPSGIPWQEAVQRTMQAKFPGFQQDVPIKENTLGSPQLNPKQGAQALLGSYAGATEPPAVQANPAHQAAAALYQQYGVDIPPVAKAISVGRGASVPIDEGQRRTITERAGNYQANALAELLQTKAWSSMDAKQRSNALTQVKNAARNKAAWDVLDSIPREKILAGMNPEQQKEYKFTALQRQLQTVPAYADKNGKPVGTPQQWQDWDRQLAQYKTGQMPAAARALADQKKEGEKAKTMAMLKSPDYLAYRQHQLGLNDEQWAEARTTRYGKLDKNGKSLGEFTPTQQDQMDAAVDLYRHTPKTDPEYPSIVRAAKVALSRSTPNWRKKLSLDTLTGTDVREMVDALAA